MIVKMKKLLLLCLAEHRVETVTHLAELGAVQVVNGKLADSAERQEVSAAIAKLERVVAAITSFKPPRRPHKFTVGGSVLLCELDAKLHSRNEAMKQLETLYRRQELLLPWGDFSFDLVKSLRKSGISVALCAMPKTDFEKFAPPEGATLNVIAQDRTLVRFALISQRALPEGLPLAGLPEDAGLADITSDIAELESEVKELNLALEAAHGALPKLLAYGERLRAENDFISCRDGMEKFGEISVIQGYVPVSRIEDITAAARRNGWGLTLEDPAEDELPPVLIELPRWLNPIRPLMEFLGILPGYREFDASLSMMIFMAIFFALLVNDAGYGFLFLAASVTGLVKFRRNPKGRQIAALMTLFSISTIGWGVLAGCWFGVNTVGWSFLTDPATKNNNIEFICFTLAVIQLSIGHICCLFKELRLRNIVTHIAWIMVLTAFYLVAVKVVAYPDKAIPMGLVKILLAAGGVLLLVFKVKWNDVGSIFNFPFEIITCFTDTLSYIRLFAVGMASGYMAACFNGMAVNIMTAVWAIPLGVLVLLAAHALNIALGLIAVLVHGVRLNTLEFSSHAGLTWSGSEYKPLIKINHNQGDEK